MFVMLKRFLLLLTLSLLSPWAWAEAVKVEGVRLWAAPDNTRVVLDVSAPVDHRVFTLAGPDRVVIDLSKSQYRAAAVSIPENSLVTRVRNGARDNGDLRLVLDLRSSTTPKSFLLPPNEQYGHRLVIDLADQQQAKAQQPVKTVQQVAGKARNVVIAIDAGHGGEDPGANGKFGTREKNVTLAIARELKKLLDAEPGMSGYLVRDGDYYVSLRDRIKRAHQANADLFVSIHADAFQDRRVHGSSVYVLSRRGASSEMARILAQSENASDLVGGVSLNDKDPLLQSVLLDLSQNASIEASTVVAENVLNQLKGIGKVHKKEVQRAGFVVLKSPDIPSILVETAFISNPDEERRLQNRSHQQKLASSLLTGIRGYFRSNPPPGTLMAQMSPTRPMQHVIQRGDTLTKIAQRYEVSLNALKNANGLRSDRVMVGDVLRIPSADS